MIYNFFKICNRAKLFSIRGIYTIILSLYKRGINLFVILDIAEKLYPDKQALMTEDVNFTYKELYRRAINLAYILRERFMLKSGKKIALCCSNSASFVISLFSASLLGSDIYLLNIGMCKNQFLELVKRHDFDFIICDEKIREYICEAGYPMGRSVDTTEILKYTKEEKRETAYERVCFNKIIVFTSGTTGIPVKVSRKASLLPYIKPFVTLFEKLKIFCYQSLYITTPISHGFGFIALLVSFVLGKTVHIRCFFNKAEACKIIRENRVEVVTLVPYILKRVLEYDAESLQSLQCIISGGALLTPELVKTTRRKLGDKLFNIYGTSEGGVCMMAAPADLRYSDETIGKPLPGVEVRLISDRKGVEQGCKEGHLQIKCKWSVEPDSWINSGDRASVDENGFFFIRGRMDDMIISGGENIFPVELENIILEHPLVYDVMAVGIDDADFGQRFKVFVVLKQDAYIDEHRISLWLSQRLPRHRMPKEIQITKEIPFNAAGKPDRIRLEILKSS